MLDAVVGAVIMVVATTSLVYSIEIAERTFDQAGRYPLSPDEREILRNIGLDNNSAESFWRENIENAPRQVGQDG